MNQQRQGELFLLGESILWGWFPIVTLLTYRFLAPLWTMTISIAVAGVFFGFLMFGGRRRSSRWPELRRREAWADLAWASFYTMLLFILLFVGLAFTTAGNAALLLFFQLFFAFLYFNLLRGEAIGCAHLVGAALMGVGAIMVIFPDDLSLNKGDILILLAAMVAPIANRYQQRARRRVHATTLLFVRNVSSLPILLLLSCLYAPPLTMPDLAATWWLLLINGVFLMGLSKIFWIESLHRLSITKISAMAALSPLFTMIFAFFILNEVPRNWQLAGVLPILVGGILITRPTKNGKLLSDCRTCH